MKRETIKNIYIVLLTIFTAISFIIVTDRLNELQEKVKYMDSKRIEYENKVDDLEKDYKLYEISLSNLKKNAKAQFCGGK